VERLDLGHAGDRGLALPEIIDNVVDMAHFFYVHFAFPTFFKNVFEGHVATQYLNTKGRPDIGKEDQLHGEQPAAFRGVLLRPVVHDRLPVARLRRFHTIDTVLINTHYPDQPDVVRAAVGRDRAQAAGPDPRAGQQAGRTVRQGHRRRLPAGRGDLEETRAGSTTRCCARRTARVYQLRRWYEQFYVDVEDVTDEMNAALRVRGGHHACGGGLGGRGSAANLAAREERERNEAQRESHTKEPSTP